MSLNDHAFLNCAYVHGACHIGAARVKPLLQKNTRVHDAQELCVKKGCVARRNLTFIKVMFRISHLAWLCYLSTVSEPQCALQENTAGVLGETRGQELGVILYRRTGAAVAAILQCRRSRTVGVCDSGDTRSIARARGIHRYGGGLSIACGHRCFCWCGVVCVLCVCLLV